MKDKNTIFLVKIFIMPLFIHDEFEFKSPLTPTELISRLASRTLERKFLATVVTNKDFIGQIDNDSFKIISSSRRRPYGATCVITGTIDSRSIITITTSVHKVFIILIAIWFVALSILYFVTSSPEAREPKSVLGFIVGMLLATALFRLFLHVMYVSARNAALTELKKVFEVI